MPRLVQNAGTPQARHFELKPGSNYVGRASGNDFQLEDGSVSGTHVQVYLDGDTISVKDLGSTNGTFINRSQVREGYLQPGQSLHLGGVELMLEGDTVNVVTAPPSPAPSAVPAPNGVRYAAPRATQAPASPPIPPPVTAIRTPPFSGQVATTEAPGGKTTCKFHPKAPARWLCTKCGQIYCDLCVNSRTAPGGAKSYFCRPCGGECTSVSYRPTVNAIFEGTFFSHLPTAFTYPFKKERKYVLIGAIVCYIIMTAIRMYIPVPFGRGFLTVLFFGYWYSYLQSIIHTTAYGDDNEPSLPEASYSELVTPVLQMFGTTVFCFLPVVGLLIWAFFQPDAETATLLLISVPLCCLYYPMALLAVAIFDSLSGVNPAVVIPAIIKTPLHYLVACIIVGAVVGCYYVGAFLLPLIIPVPIVPMAISSCFWLYFMMVMSRVLGLLYFYNRDRLGWLHHR